MSKRKQTRRRKTTSGAGRTATLSKNEPASPAATARRSPIPADVANAHRKHPVLRAVLVFSVLLGLFYGLVHNPYIGADYFEPYLGFIARAAGGLLTLLGYEATVHDTFVSIGGFSAEIVRGCDAIEPTVAFAAAVLASPASLWMKIPGIFAGALVLFVINFIRIVSLFLVGIYFPQALDLIHMDVWQATFIVLAICLWAIWIQWATHRKCAAGRTEAPRTNARRTPDEA